MVDMPAAGGSYIRDPSTGDLMVAPAVDAKPADVSAVPKPAAPATTDTPADPAPAPKSGA